MPEPASPRFLTELGQTFVEPYVVAELRTEGNDLLWSSEDASSAVIDSASVTEDRSRDSEHIDMSLGLRIDDTDQALIDLLVPDSALHPLAPLRRTQLRLRAGLRFADGATETVPAGFGFVDNTTTVRDDIGVLVTVQAVDPSRQLELARIIADWNLFGATKTFWLSQWVTQVLGAGWPRRIIDDARSINGTQIDDQTSRWQLMQDVAKNGLQYRHGFDREGEYVAEPDPLQLGTANWLLTDSEARFLGRVEHSVGDDNVYSGVVVRGEPASSTAGAPPVQGVVWDENPDSPTYYDPDNASASLIGPRPFFVNSQFIYTTSQALATARKRLPEVTAMQQAVAFEARYNPLMVPWDTARFEVPEVKLDAGFVLMARQLDLFGGPMRIICETRELAA